WVDAKAHQLPKETPVGAGVSAALVMRTTGGDSRCSARTGDATRKRAARTSRRQQPQMEAFAYVRIVAPESAENVPTAGNGPSPLHRDQLTDFPAIFAHPWPPQRAASVRPKGGGISCTPDGCMCASRVSKITGSSLPVTSCPTPATTPAL